MATSSPSIPDRLSSLFPTTTESEEETQSLGTSLAEVLAPGRVVGLYGDLGTGKTQLVKGIARGLGIPASAVRSPTFTILHTYEDGRHSLYHFDAYRIQTPDEFVELGFREYVQETTSPHRPGITCVEWADRIDALLPPDTLHLSLHHEGPHRRRITVRAESDPSTST
jgi:tRNA threonylcarbamoyladenosine biosynthesis protein TsaE